MTDADATTMASQLESNASKYQASKFSTYNDGSNGVNTPLSQQAPNAGMNFNYSSS